MYLEYFLKNLDPQKMNQEYKDLQKLLDHLSETNPINVVMYLPDITDLKVFKTALESDKSGFEVYGFTDAKVALTSAFKQRIHILVIDLDIQHNILENFITTYQKTMIRIKKEPKVIGITSRINDETVSLANSLDIDSLLEKEEDAVEIIDTVYDMLKVDTSEYLSTQPTLPDILD